MKTEEKVLQEEKAGLAFAGDKGFFYSYNVIFDLELSKNAKLLYLYLCRRADGNSKTFPSYATMASACSLSRSTAIRAMKELMLEGLLLRKHQQHGKEFTSNQYLLYAAPDEEVKRMNLKELEKEKKEAGRRIQSEKVTVGKYNTEIQDNQQEVRKRKNKASKKIKSGKKEQAQIHKTQRSRRTKSVEHSVRNFPKKIGETGVGFTLLPDALKGQMEIEGVTQEDEKKEKKEGWCHCDTRGSPI